MSEDIDSFIQQQKTKLAEERDNLDTSASTTPKQNQSSSSTVGMESGTGTGAGTPEGTGSVGALPVGGYEEKRRRLGQERQKEYNDLIARAHAERSTRCQYLTGNSLRFDSGTEIRRRLADERRAEYNAFVQGQQQGRPARSYSPEHTSLRFDSGTALRVEKEKQRNQEYNQTRAQLQTEVKKTASPAYVGLPMGQYEAVRRSLEEERAREYRKHREQTPEPSVRRKISPEHVGLPVGEYEEVRKSLEEERARECREHMEKSPGRRPDSPQRAMTPENTSLSLDSRTRVRRQLEEQRNREYNEFLQHKQQRDAGADPASLEHVGLPLTGSNVARQRAAAKLDANREYNEFLAQGPKETESCQCPHEGLNIGGGAEEARRRLQKEETNKDYNAFLRAQQETPNGVKKAASACYAGLPLGVHEETRRRANAERADDMQSHLQKGSPPGGAPAQPASATAQNLSLPVSDSRYLRYRHGLKQATQEEYNQFLHKSEKKSCEPEPVSTPEESEAGDVEPPTPAESEGVAAGAGRGGGLGVSLPLTGSEQDRQRVRLTEERNQEYNELLKSPRARRKWSSGTGGGAMTFTSHALRTQEVARLRDERTRETQEHVTRQRESGGAESIAQWYTGLRISDSDYLRRRAEFNREKQRDYQQYLQQHQPRRARPTQDPICVFHGTQLEKCDEEK